ncbi:MAG TPA: ABC transporter permease [Methanomicrobiales archaeon]|nr:ABC transporter permease [Methanomicrobiales archaeon]
MIREGGAIFKRDMKKFLSNPFVVIMSLLMPLMYMVVFGNAVGGTLTAIPLGVVQGGLLPTADTPLFLASVPLLGHYIQEKGDFPLFDVTVYTSEDIGKRDLSLGKIKGLVVFPSELNDDTTVRLYLDSSEYTIPQLIEAGVSAVLAGQGAVNPVLIEKIYGDIKFLQFFGISVVVLAIFTSTSFGGGIAIIKDRENGIHEGYLVTPVERSSIIFGIISSGTLRAFLAGFIIFLIALLATGIRVASVSSFLLVLVVIFIVCVGVTSLVVSFASRFSNQQEYASVNAFLNLVMFMTSGAFYPVLGMPGWLRWITAINPEYYGIHALRSIILRGQGLEVIGIDLVALLIFSTAMIVLGIMTYRRTLE